MMKKILLVFVLFVLLGAVHVNAQTPDWVWARSAPTSFVGEGISIATDSFNNVLITGNYRDSIAFGPYLLTNTQGRFSSFFLAKYDFNGNVKWAKTASAGTLSVGRAVATDAFGNSYITGHFADTISFGSYTLTSVGSYFDTFLVKYDSSGNVLWAKSTGGTDNDYGNGVAIDKSGNVYVTGYFKSAFITIGTFTLTNVGGGTCAGAPCPDLFIAKYDSSGNVLWANSVGGLGDDEGNNITVDALANVIITGYFTSSTLTFGSYILTNLGNEDIFLAKYDSSGNVLWAKNAIGTGDGVGMQVTTDKSDNIYVTGSYFGFFITFDSDTLATGGAYDAFLVKYSASGNVLWAKGFGGTSDESGYCVTADKFNKIYITGEFNSQAITFDTITIQKPSNFTDPMYFAEYDSSGHVLFAQALPSGGDDWCPVLVSPSGCIYMGGDFMPATFILGNDTLINNVAIEDVFVAKLCYQQIGANISEISTDKEFISYPNPFTNNLTITCSNVDACVEASHVKSLQLFDVTSREILHRSFINSVTIDTSPLARGIYFYEVRSGNRVLDRERLIKE